MSEQDETKDTMQDGSDKTPSAGEDGTTSKEAEPQTYTKDQVDKAINDALSKAGRDVKALETQRNELTQLAETINATKAEIEKARQEQEVAFMENIKSNPDAVDWVTEKKKLEDWKKTLAKQEADFNKKTLEYDAQIKSAQEAQKEINIFSVASEKKIDPQRLKTLSDKFGITDKDKLAELADEIASGQSQPGQNVHVDSGITTGGKQGFATIRFDKEAPSGHEMISKGLKKK